MTMRSMLLAKNAITIWIVANVLASAIFTHLASWTWLEPNLRGEDAVRGGDAAVWMFGAFPVLALSGVANCIWFVLTSKVRHQGGGAWPSSSIIIVSTIWISALVVDHLRGLGL
jgi:hypothetical protein